MLPISYKTQNKLRTILMYALAIAGAAMVIFPYVWVGISAFKPNDEIFVYPPRLLPSRFDTSHFLYVLDQLNILLYVRNSVIVGFATTAACLVLSIPAAYALTRFNLRFKRTFARLVLLVYMVPYVVLIVPIFLVFSRLGFTNSFLGLTIAHTAIGLPFCMWVLWAFFRSIPKDLEEAAFIDGADRFTTVTKIVLPCALPGIVASGLFAFLASWNDYLFASILVTRDGFKTLPLSLVMIYGNEWLGWGVILSALLVATIPAFTIIPFVQGQLIKGYGVVAEH